METSLSGGKDSQAITPKQLEQHISALEFLYKKLAPRHQKTVRTVYRRRLLQLFDPQT